jgi:putative hemolysin
MEGIMNLYFILFFICLVAAAFFCSAETAFIGTQRLRLQHLIYTNHPKARIVAKIVERPERFLATVLLAINFFESAVATLGTLIAVSLWGENLGAAIATIMITVLTLVFAELIPKSLAARYGERLALSYAKPIQFITSILYPFVYILNHIGSGVNKLLGIADESKPTISEEEFRTAIILGETEGVWEQAEAEMLHKVFEFGDRRVMEIMTPRPDIVWLESGTKLSDFFPIFAQNPHSRFPVYEDSIDNVIGVLLIKDVLKAQAEGAIQEEGPIDSLVRPAYFVPETKRIDGLLAEMQATGNQIAIAIDEFGGTAGLVTMDQLVTEIVGRVGEELERREEEYKTIDEKNVEVDGGLHIDEANEELDLGLPSGQYETVAGYVLSLLGHIPKEGEQATHNSLRLIVTEMEGVKIKKVLISRL